MILNANSMVQLATQIKSGLIINVNVGVKIIKSARESAVGSLANAFVKMASI